jgi:hypothetical protein
MSETNQDNRKPTEIVTDALIDYAREQMLKIAEDGGPTARKAMANTLRMNERLSVLYRRKVTELEQQLAYAQSTIRSLVGAWNPDDPTTVVPNPPPDHQWGTGGVSGLVLCMTCKPVVNLLGGRATTATECLAAYRAKGGNR